MKPIVSFIWEHTNLFDHINITDIYPCAICSNPSFITGNVCLSSISLCERKGTGRVPFFSWWAKFLITSGAQVIISSPAGRVLTMVPVVRGKTAIFCNIEYQLQVWFQMHWYTWPINITQVCHILIFPGPSWTHLWSVSISKRNLFTFFDTVLIIAFCSIVNISALKVSQNESRRVLFLC